MGVLLSGCTKVYAYNKFKEHLEKRQQTWLDLFWTIEFLRRHEER